MSRLGREAPLPDEMQGRWVDSEDPSFVVVIDGGEVTYRQTRSEYDYKEIAHQDGALCVFFGVDDEAKEDDFARGSVNGLAMTPDGELHMWNMKFACQLVRPGSQD
jgi:hypothetical protein